MANKSGKKETSETKEQPKPKCGIIMPISAIEGYPAEHWAEVKEILLEVISQTEFEGDLVSSANETRVIHETIVQNIYFNEMVVCDVSGKNPNVMFELGLRIAFDKPAVIIKDEATNYSFDTSPIEHLSYPTDLNYRKINQFKEELKSKIKATYENSKTGSPYLKSFGRLEVAKVETEEVTLNEYLIESMNDLKNDLTRLRGEINLNKSESSLVRSIRAKPTKVRFSTRIDGDLNIKEFARLLSAYFPQTELTFYANPTDKNLFSFDIILIEYMTSSEFIGRLHEACEDLGFDVEKLIWIKPSGDRDIILVGGPKS